MNEFEIVSGKAYVADPCYKPDMDCCNLVENLRTGRWKTTVSHQGNRVAELEVSHIDEKSLSWEYSPNITVPVDSGQAGVFDADFFRKKEEAENTELEASPLTGENAFYNLCCDITLSKTKNGFGALPHGVVSSSGYGDGEYETMIAKNNNGEIVGIRIVFIDWPHYM